MTMRGDNPMIVLDKQMAHRAENHSIEFRQYLYLGIIIAKRICIATIVAEEEIFK